MLPSPLQDFEEAERAHDRFLQALVAQSFLGSGILGKQLSEVFGQSAALCRLVKGAREDGIDWPQVQVRMPGGMGAASVCSHDSARSIIPVFVRSG